MSFNRVEIDLAALAANFQLLASRLPATTRQLVMVKSEAYGHGLERSALALARAGATAFGVAELEEGVRLRRAGITGEILVALGLSPDDDPADVLRHDVQVVVCGAEDIDRLRPLAGSGGAPAVHLKVDVGMGRLGCLPAQAPGLVDMVRAAGLRLAGLMAHFPLADEDVGATREHLQRFLSLVARLRPALPAGCRLHIANSAAMLRGLGTELDWVRPGIALYGAGPAGLAPAGLRPVMAMKSSVVQVKEVPAGSGVSYGHTFVTRRRSRIAVLPVGYDDGYLRRLSGRAWVLIRGRRCPVVGTICMNACMADVTGLPEVTAGDEVVLLGRQGDEEIAAEEIARWSDTISYEILCLFGSRNRRVFRGV